jgi:hypothetical protein
MVTVYTTTFTHPTIIPYPHTAHLGLLYGPQQAPSIFLSGNEGSVLRITDTECVYYAVRTEYLN